MSAADDDPRGAKPVAARRRLEGDHRAAAGRRPSLLRRDRQGRRAQRGRGAPARAEAHRVRRHAGRRRHRSDAARLLPPGDDRHPRHRRHHACVAEALAAIPRVDYVVLTAGSFDMLAEVVCENDDDLIELLNKRIRAIDGRAVHRDVRLPQAAEAVLQLGNTMTTTEQDDHHDSRTDAARRRRRCSRRRRTTSGCTSPASP